MTRSRQTADWGSRAGLAKIVPSSVAVGSGTGSADALGNVTFSGASSVSLNGIFSSTYDNYRIMFLATSSTTSQISIRLRTSGTDASGSNYNLKGYYSGTANGNLNQASTTNWFNFGLNSGNAPVIIDLFRPFSAATTLGYANLFTSDSGYNHQMAIEHTLSTSYDGLSLIISAGTISGNVRVYGITQ
jgi:hypothetical protein